MANVTWDTTTSGAVVDTTGASVGTADGAGTVTIDAAANVLVQAGFTLTVEAGVTVAFGASAGVLVRGTGGGGALDINGTMTQPVIFTSTAGSPAAGDWDGVALSVGNVADATVDANWLILEYSTSGISAPTTASAGHIVSCTDCKFRHIAQSHITTANALTETWALTRCVFEKCTADQSTDSDLIAISGTSTVTLNVDHCTVYAEWNRANDIYVFNCGNVATMSVIDSIFEATNANTGDGLALELSGAGGGTFTSSYTWRTVDGDGDFVAGATDTVQDAGFFDDGNCPGDLDLRPDHTTGVSTADSSASLLGALSPYNTPSGPGTGGEPDDRENVGGELPPDKTTAPLEGPRQRVIKNDISEVFVRGAINAFNNTTVHWKDDITSRRAIRRWGSGSIQLPSGSSQTVHLSNITSARVLIVESSTSATVTFANSQKVNIGGPDGFWLGHIWRNKGVGAFVVTQSTGTTATVNWFGAQ